MSGGNAQHTHTHSYTYSEAMIAVRSRQTSCFVANLAELERGDNEILIARDEEEEEGRGSNCIVDIVFCVPLIKF